MCSDLVVHFDNVSRQFPLTCRQAPVHRTEIATHVAGLGFSRDAQVPRHTTPWLEPSCWKATDYLAWEVRLCRTPDSLQSAVILFGSFGLGQEEIWSHVNLSVMLQK